MSLIRGKNTRPEMQVRTLLHGLGYRYRLHYGAVPGKPDIAFPGRRKVIYVHGCFWHYHEGCPYSHIPKSNSGYWKEKLERNRQRDQVNVAGAQLQGWECLVIWECELRTLGPLKERLLQFLGPPRLQAN